MQHLNITCRKALTMQHLMAEVWLEVIFKAEFKIDVSVCCVLLFFKELNSDVVTPWATGCVICD